MASSDAAPLDGVLAKGEWGDRGPEFDYLRVDAFLRDLLSARALASGFEIGLVDALLRNGPACVEDLAARLRMDLRGMGLLTELLLPAGVLCETGGRFGLSRAFTEALAYRDLLELKLAMCLFGAHDLLERFDTVIRASGRSPGNLRFCRLFSYDRALVDTPENRDFTRRWMGLTTGLTRYEAPVCLAHHDFSSYRSMLDLGGNSGEFALQACRRHSDLLATVVDLPVVCCLGEEHVVREPEADRIRFVAGDAVEGPLPSGFDVVVFKSMLHDWPDELAGRLLANAARAVRPGGTLLIFERAPLRISEAPAFALLPWLLFFRSFRPVDLYVRCLRELGFVQIRISEVELEMTFHLLIASRGA